MIYLDTHVVVWLYAGDTERLSSQAREHIESEDLLVTRGPEMLIAATPDRTLCGSL